MMEDHSAQLFVRKYSLAKDNISINHLLKAFAKIKS
jgi:hypothetical protein